MDRFVERKRPDEQPNNPRLMWLKNWPRKFRKYEKAYIKYEFTFTHKKDK